MQRLVPNERRLAEQSQRIVELETERTLLKGIVAEQARQLAEQARQLAEQEQQIAEQAQRITELEAKLAQNSTNSSRPPSSDRPKTSKKPRKRRKGGKRRRRGGQPGHKGHGRVLVPLSEVSKVVPLHPSQCRCCQHELNGTDAEPHRHQVTELPPIQPTVTEYQLHRLRCSQCGTTTRAELPKDVPQGSFGPRLQAVVALASGVYRMSKRMIESFFSDLCGIRISLGSVSNLENKTSKALAQPVAEAHRYLQQQHVLYADETGWRQGQQRRMWLWLAAGTHVAVFLIRPHRSMKEAKELLGSFQGYLHTDRMPSYGFVPAERRQVCWSHLLRDIEAFRPLGRGGKQLATSVQRPMRQILRMYHRMCAGGLSRRWLQRQSKPLQQEILFHLRRGAAWRQDAIAGVCKTILKLKNALFTFIAHEGIEPTNNHSERLLRHAVLWRKSSFGTDSDRGSRFVERILTACTSLRLQKRNVLDYLTDVARAALLNEQPPSLLPTLPVAP